MLILIFEKPVNVQCVYSLTSTPSAPIIWDKKNNQGKCKALIVNSGNANAHTGRNGINIINKYVLELTKKIKCKKNEILVSSTGVIGEIFDPSIIINSINKINKTKSVDLIEAAKTIMTTDTYPKTSIKNVKIQNTNILDHWMSISKTYRRRNLVDFVTIPNAKRAAGENFEIS